MYFHYFVISPWKRAWPFIWGNLKLHQSKLLCAKFGWNWHSGSGSGEDFNISFELTWIPFTQGCFVPCLVEIRPVVLGKKMKTWKVHRQTVGRSEKLRGDYNNTLSFYCEEKQCTQHPTIPHYQVTAKYKSYIGDSHSQSSVMSKLTRFSRKSRKSMEKFFFTIMTKYFGLVVWYPHDQRRNVVINWALLLT